ncbi:MAG: MFS transporter [Kiloniellaceae bacterium]
MTRSAGLPPYRWVIVAASALILATAMGTIVNGMSAFLVPMQEAYGWERGDIALINVAGLLGLAFGGLLMGPLADRCGTRPVVFFGVTVLGLCYLAASLADALWHYYLLMVVAGFFGAAAIFPPIMAAIGNWFPIGAGLAIGVASAGQALGQGGAPFVSSLLIQSLGISGAFGAIGALMLAVLVPLAALLRQPPGGLDRGQSEAVPSDRDYPPSRVVIPAMSVAILLCCTSMSVPLMHLVPLIQDKGFALDEASSVIFVMLLVAIAGRIAFGKLADFIGALPAYMTATAWMTVMIYGFVRLESLDAFYVYAVVYGFGYAGVMTGVLVTITALTHPARRGTAMGIVIMFGWFGHAGGGYLGGVLFDLTGGYALAYGIAAATGVANLIVVGLLYLRTRGPQFRLARP